MAYQKLQAERAAAVTPSNTVNIPSVSTADGTGNNGCVLYVGVAGDLKAQNLSDITHPLLPLQDQELLP